VNSRGEESGVRFSLISGRKNVVGSMSSLPSQPGPLNGLIGSVGAIGWSGSRWAVPSSRSGSNVQADCTAVPQHADALNSPEQLFERGQRAALRERSARNCLRVPPTSRAAPQLECGVEEKKSTFSRMVNKRSFNRNLIKLMMNFRVWYITSRDRHTILPQ
jgi:hypothetical protein